MSEKKLTDIIAPSFYKVHDDIKNCRYTHYKLPGGRGSTKSSFAAVEIVLGIVRDCNAHAVVLRKVADTLHDSVYTQLLWAIDALGLENEFTSTVSPLKITYDRTGQTIIFRGADKPDKIKSAKAPFGYFKYIWYEEYDQFSGDAEIRKINQSLMRGGKDFVCFYTFNPPASVQAWVNEDVTVLRPDTLVYRTNYLSVSKDWLGPAFITEAEHLKKVNEERYRHEYLGEVTGTGGEVFRNIALREISGEEIARFDRIRRGVDWGYAVDPFIYIVCHYDKTRRRLYVFHEFYAAETSNRRAAEVIKAENKSNSLVVADSAEPKSIADLNTFGVRMIGAKKGPDSVKHGIDWLKDLEEIIIDPVRCPNAAREFTHYELERDRNGNFKASYPDKENHTIDAVRYATEDDQINLKVT